MIKKVLLVSGSLSLLSACVVDPPNDEPTTQQQSLIINDFNVYPVTHFHAESVSDFNNNDTTAALLNYRQMALTRTANQVHTTQIRDGENCAATVSSDGKGSGSLTSTNRILTAHHVVAGAEEIVIRFESSDLEGAVPLNGEPPTIPDPNDPTKTIRNPQYERTEEVPLLANRLYGLGLDNWAVYSNLSTRKKLREWTAVTDEENGDVQPFVSFQSKGKYSGKDISFLRVTELKDEIKFDNSSEQLASGPFLIGAPGPLYNITKTLDYQYETECSVDNTHPVKGLYFQDYPEQQTNLDISLIASGYLDSMGPRDICADLTGPKKVCINAFEVKNEVDYKDCVASTLDIKPGCSGGSLLANTCEDLGDGQIGDHQRDVFIIQGVANGQEFSPTDVTIWDDHTQEYEEVGRMDLDTEEPSYSLFAALDVDAVDWSDRDKSYEPTPNPFNPRPDQPESDGFPSDCGSQICDNDFEIGVSTGLDQPLEPTDVPPDEFDEYLRDQGIEILACISSANNGSLQTSVNWGPTGNWRISAGLMQGLLGSSTTEYPISATRIDAMTPICVPWSSQTWLNNWRWARVSKLNVTNLSTAKYLKGYASLNSGKLFDVLAMLYEAYTVVGPNVDPTPSIKPPSMKNCPPNYYLSGVDYTYNNTSSGNEIAGIYRLRCQLHHPLREQKGTTLPANQPNAITVQLNTDHTSDYDGYYFGDDLFKLDQNIGDSRAANQPNRQYGSSVCSSGKGAIGLMMGRNTNSTIAHLHLLCARAPGAP